MIKYQKHYTSEEEKQAFVLECERSFEDQLIQASRVLSADEDISYITLAGPTCSGKTTTAKKLISDLERLGRRVHVVSFDDFYRERSTLHAVTGKDGREQIDYDSVNAIDLAQLQVTLGAIFRHQDVRIPVYDFEAGKTASFTELDLSPGDLVIFEGIQAIYPEVVSLFSAHKYRSIYISVQGEIELGGRVFTGRDIRFWRRVVRDYHFRGATPDFSYFIWDSVCRNEDMNMTPYAGKSDIYVNSLMPCEPGIIKTALVKILSEVKPDSPCAADAAEIISCFDEVEPISPDYLPKASVYHEFIG